MRLVQSGEAYDVCRTQAETRVFSVVVDHLRREWGGEGPPSEESERVRSLLSRVHVAVADLEQGEPAAIEADQLLRGLLLDPELSGLAWTHLIDMANQVAILQAGVTGASIAQHLTSAGLQLGPQLDFRPDIDRLRSYSSQVVARLQLHRSVIGDDGTAVHIDRQFALDLRAATDESLLITGDPGAGKSGALAELIDLHASDDVVAFSADSLAHLTSGELRSEIGLDHSLTEVLTNWRSDRPGLVVIDALDAGRGSRAQQALMGLIVAITQTAGRWKVVATVRRFDLRYSPTLKELFPTAGSEVPETYTLPEFARVRHFNIGALTPSELGQLENRAPRLSEKVRNAAPALRDLLSNPFSLRLFAELVSHGDATQHGTPISSRLELLDSYWERRVLDSPSGSFRRENLLRRMCDEMITRGVLTVDGARVAENGNAEDLADLLRTGLLVEDLTGPFGATRLLAFAHHVLFDYAVARLFLSDRDIPTEAASNPISLFLVRPSYQMYFEGLWRARPDRQTFWALAMTMSASPEVPEIAKVIAPAVASSLITRDQDLAILLAALESETPGAVGVLQHLINALLTDDAGHAVSADHALVWAKFAEALSRRLDIPRAIAVRHVIRELIAIEPTLSHNATAAINLASQRLLRWTWAEGRADRFFTHFAISGVTSTFTADPVNTAVLIRAIITPRHLAEYGYIEMPSLADVVPSLLPHDPELVRDIYVAAFGYDERSTDITEITRGILNMTSNRRQDYNHAHYTLAEHFPTFIEASPQSAIEALSSVYGRYASRSAYSTRVVEVAWADERFSFIDDYLFEHLHDSSDEEAQILNAFGDWLHAGQDSTDEQGDRYHLAAETLRSLTAPAGLWRTLLRGIPSSVGLHMVGPLLRSPDALTSRGLTKVIGEVLRIRFADLNTAHRLEIEQAIMHLDPLDGRTVRIRRRLIGLLPESSLQTEEARVLWRESRDDEYADGGHAASVEEADGDFDRAEEVRQFGIDPDAVANAAIIAEAQPVRDFNDRHLNAVPSPNAVRDVWPRIVALWSRLREPLATEASRRLIVWSFGDVARAVDILSRSELAAAMSSAQLRELVELVGGLMSHRTDEPEDLDEFDAGAVRTFELPTWVVQASVGLIAQGHDDDRLDALILAAAVDRSPSVRYSVASQIWRLRDARPDMVQRTLALMEVEEQSGSVMGRLAATIANVGWERPDEVVERLRQLHARATALGARGEGARETCSEVAAALYIRQGSASAKAFLAELIDQATDTAADLKGIAEEFRDAFAAFGPEGDARRRRAFELAVQVTSRASTSFAAARDLSAIESGESNHSDKLVKDLAHLIDSISSDAYFSSGAYQRSGEETASQEKPPMAAYYGSSRDLLLALPEIPFPSVVHHVLQTLDYLSPTDPAQIFRDITDVIVRGRAGGYEYDQLAASFVTGSVSRFLVQHGHLLQTDPDLRTCLIKVLDTFVAVGWGEARMLTYQLDIVFR